MATFESFEETINTELERLCRQLPSAPPELYDPIKYVLSNKAKRVRPAMALMACNLFGGDVEKAVPAALGIELFHNFTLIHDDLMDNAPMRRGRPSVQQKWNNNVAILSGDGIFVKSMELISKTDSPVLKKILEVFTKTAMQVCEGQQLDMTYEATHQISLGQYLKMIELKTAVLIAASLEIGALTGGSGEEDARNLYEFGKNMGIAFQLQDDILDVYGEEHKFGKQKGGDIIANKKTYLLVKAMELASGYIGEELNNWVFAPEFAPQDKIAAVTGIYDRLNVKKLAETEMQKYALKARAFIKNSPANSNKKEALIAFTDRLLNRDK